MFARVRVDLFGFIDIVCLRGSEPGIIGVQTTSRSHIGDRIKKIMALPVHKEWLDAGNKIVVEGWDKKDNRWRVKTVPILE